MALNSLKVIDRKSFTIPVEKDHFYRLLGENTCVNVCEKRRTRCGRIQEMPGLSFQEERQVSEEARPITLLVIVE